QHFALGRAPIPPGHNHIPMWGPNHDNFAEVYLATEATGFDLSDSSEEPTSDSLRICRSASDKLVATASVQPDPTRSKAFGTPPANLHSPTTIARSGNLEWRRL